MPVSGLAAATRQEDGRDKRAQAGVASAKLGREGHLVRLWRPPVAPGERTALGLYRANSEVELDQLLGALPLSGWMKITVNAA